MKKIVGSTLELSAKVFFSLHKYQLKIWVEKTVLAVQHIGNRKSLPPPPVTKLFFLHTVVVLYFTHHMKMARLVTVGGGGGCQNAKKQYIIKTY